MANGRLEMRNLREILRLKWVLQRSHRVTAQAVGVADGTVAGVLHRARQHQLDWEAVQQLSDAELERLLYGPPTPATRQRPEPDMVWIHRELRSPGVTLELLHLEYLKQEPDGLRYTAFCNHYRAWRKKIAPTMRQVHRGGEKLFVDYSGKRPSLVDPATGEVRPVELFVAVLGASNFTYAEATETQSSQDWIAAHIRALEYFRGVPAMLVPDQLKSGVTAACRYEPSLQRTYLELARHYDTAVVPARPAKPRDKAKVEVAVQVVQRWVLARLRNEVFHSLATLNRRIRELLEQLNDRPMKGYGGLSRREMYARYDAPLLRPLPPERFEHAEWKKAKVNIDYHVELAGHFYSVPYQLARQTVELRATASTVEVYLRGQRVAAHARSNVRGRHTTRADHMPKSHRAHLEWSPSRMIRWAETVGPATRALISDILANRPHPEMGYRSCLGILRLSKVYSNERLEAACQRGLAVRARSYRSIAAILKNGLDRMPAEPAPAEQPTKQQSLPGVHENVRGPDYYH